MSTVAVQFALLPNFSHLAFGDETSIDEVMFHVLSVRKRKDPDRLITKAINDQVSCKTIGDLRKLTDHEWRMLCIPSICRIYLKYITRQSKRKDGGGPKTFMDILQDDFNLGQPFDMSLYQNHLAMLTAMGFTHEQAMEALVITENKGIEPALEILFQQDKSVRETRRQEARQRIGKQVVKTVVDDSKEEPADINSIKKSLESERQKRLKLEFDIQLQQTGARKIFYKEFLRGLVSQDSIAVVALEKLSEYRKEHGITEEDHVQILSELGFTVEKFDQLKNLEAKSGNECVVCLDKRRDHLVQPCMHLCLCGDCSEKSKKGNCPICSKKVENIVRIFTA